MGIFDFFKKDKPTQSDNVVDGLTHETAIRILPPSDPAQIRKLREAGRIYFEKIASDKGTSSALDELKNMTTSQQMNGLIDAFISEEFKMIRLNQMFGEEGKSWKCGDREYFDNDIQSQEILFHNGKRVTLFFDFSEYHSIAMRMP